MAAQTPHTPRRSVSELVAVPHPKFPKAFRDYLLQAQETAKLEAGGRHVIEAPTRDAAWYELLKVLTQAYARTGPTHRFRKVVDGHSYIEAHNAKVRGLHKNNPLGLPYNPGFKTAAIKRLAAEPDLDNPKVSLIPRNPHKWSTTSKN